MRLFQSVMELMILLLNHIIRLFSYLESAQYYEDAKGKEGIRKYGDLIINIHKGTIRHHDEEMILTKNEMIILTSLINHANRIVTRDELMTELWNSEEYINDNALTVNISRLRSKLKDFGYEDLITTRKGQGYILS